MSMLDQFMSHTITSLSWEILLSHITWAILSDWSFRLCSGFDSWLRLTPKPVPDSPKIRANERNYAAVLGCRRNATIALQSAVSPFTIKVQDLIFDITLAKEKAASRALTRCAKIYAEYVAGIRHPSANQVRPPSRQHHSSSRSFCRLCQQYHDW